MMGYEWLLVLTGLMLVIGVIGLLLKGRNMVNVLMAVEIMLLAVSINFVGFSALRDDLHGQVFSLFVLAVAAAEAAIGLSILIVYHRNKGDIELESASSMKE